MIPVCQVAAQSTDGKFYCTRRSGHDGPCAARRSRTQVTPEQRLKDFLPAFRDLFSEKTPDLARFLRLTIQVFDPNPPVIGYRGCSEIRDPSVVTLTSDGTSVIGRCRATSNHGDSFTDAPQTIRSEECLQCGCPLEDGKCKVQPWHQAR